MRDNEADTLSKTKKKHKQDVGRRNRYREDRRAGRIVVVHDVLVGEEKKKP